jgi:hypothetical protein
VKLNVRWLSHDDEKNPDPCDTNSHPWMLCVPQLERDLPNYNYLKNEEIELDGFSEESFQPSLKDLKALLSSIHVD